MQMLGLEAHGSFGVSCLLSNTIMDIGGTRLVVLKVPKTNRFEKLSTSLSLFRNHDPVTQDNPQTL